MTLTIRPAVAADFDTVVSLWNEAAEWLASRGIDQWQYAPRHPAIRRNIAAGECWIVDDDQGAPVATITVDAYADPDFWRPEDDPDSALYAHRMAIRRAWSGQEIGSAMLDYAGQLAREAGRRWLRLDAWRDNTELQAYYVRRAFQPVRLADAPHRQSGALFQRPASITLGLGPTLRQVDTTTR